ncbi:23S rRNA (adenine(2030)-N(6))-methyltransferase RlmJ [Marinibactrum halimedae]|uniref:Ribosomal RNA large subunit methyltransferase J n=1 Tax=Marinibactrum halimedae TaxID=1444977 RepID=A0AA37TAB4_9GAMM|nr:23S rRNA (adenine(2030)-N(6))-methyltransferase RlmJ [Marinibactrum halimedae]MCD9460179.1 23S rRNA (adenine(2030)-N(6))-methyltransferase RlmJ [Marinibactrum halimedae]GLS26350.1 ribosomal RNA large subunit methyltransferase J [Marinibactrum halimedae]
MLSYQHCYHAGNHADVLKHWLLLECVQYLQKKPKPFDYIDTHAGEGLYNLTSAEAQKTGESASGIGRVPWNQLPGLDAYHHAIEHDLIKQSYPGSPLLIKRLLRPGDKAWLFELHPQAIVPLKKHCAQKGLSVVQHSDGFIGLLSLLPTQSRRALVLIDPSYEVKSDYLKVVEIMEKAYKKMPNSMMLLWYPVVDRQWVKVMESTFRSSSLRNVQLFEMGVEDENNKGMTASGMVVVNPPYTLEKKFHSTIPALSKALSEDGIARTRFDVLVGE